MNKAVDSQSKLKAMAIATSLLTHVIICFVGFSSFSKDAPDEIIPIGLKIIPSIVKNDEVMPILPTKKKAVLKKIRTKKIKVGKVAKVPVREGEKTGKAVSLKQRYLYELSKYIERNKVYPKKAKRLKQQGRVFLSFIVDADGKFKDLKLAKSSSFESLDKGALKLLKNISTFKPLPEELKVSSLTVTQPITYQIQ